MRIVIGAMMLALMLGCQSKESQQVWWPMSAPMLLHKDEFDDAYKNSAYVGENNASYRSEFLKNMINQKLILLDAERAAA